MSKRFNNIRLLYILAGLAVLLILTIVVKVPKDRATLKYMLVDFDSTDVSKILLYPKGGDGNVIEFSRKNDKWEVKQGNIAAATQKGTVSSVLTEVLKLKPVRLAATNKSKWKEFELTDSLATRVKFQDKKGKNLADVMIGKISFKQASNPYGGYGGNNIQGTSYVRLAGEKEVFAVDGFLSFTFNRKFDEWRDKSFIKFNKNDATKISFTFPADSSFTIIKNDSVWYAGNILADSLNTINYLNSICMLNGQNFKDGFKPISNPIYQIQIEGNNLLNFYIKCYKGEGVDEYILNSGLYPEIYYTSNRKGLFDQLFKPLSYFIIPGKKK